MFIQESEGMCCYKIWCYVDVEELLKTVTCAVKVVISETVQDIDSYNEYCEEILGYLM